VSTILKYDYTEGMLRLATHINNILGGLLKLSVLPILLTLLGEEFLQYELSGPLHWLSWLLIILGIFGMGVASLMIYRYGSGQLHFNKHPHRLVDMGLYAMTRHPNFWFFNLYLIGVMLRYFGPGGATAIISMGCFTTGALYLYFVQERVLKRSLGNCFETYCEETPFLTWRFKIPANRKVYIFAQVVWFMSRTVLRKWYKIQVTGMEHVPYQKPFLVIANHECFLDPFLFGIFIPFEMRFVTTADVFSSPLMRFLLKGSGTFPMRRHRQDLKSIRTMIRMVKQGQVVGIFPEGGRSLYGEPLPILNETIKLIQACKVPILPIRLDGAYEIWPRWAPNRRRGQVKVGIQPIIPIEDQQDREALETKIAEAIFTPEKHFRHVRSRNMAKGMDRVMWGCVKCRSLNSIQVISGDQISCSACSSTWNVQNNYSFIEEGSGPELTMIEWMHGIEDAMLVKAPQPQHPSVIPLHERLYLSSPIRKYQVEDGITIKGKLILVLSVERFVLLRDDAILESWPLKSVTVFTMDYHNAVSIGVAGIRHSFFLPRSEVALKWQTFYEALDGLSSPSD